MLSIAKVAMGGEGYYLSTVARGIDHGGGAGGLIEPDGIWLGEGAAALGLSGVAEPDAVRRLLAGVDPTTGEILSDLKGFKWAAYDCTLSAPKSVSILHALGPDEVGAEVRAAHDSAVVATLGYLEREAVAVRRTKRDERWREPTDGVIAVGFVHRASRAPDPHLHTHLVIVNLGHGADGRWSALDGTALYRESGAARALYETHLRGELTVRLGVHWEPLRGVWADIDGLPPRLRNAFSRRATQIRESAAAEGLTGIEALKLMAEITRPPKDLTVTHEDLVAAWEERAFKLGVSLSSITRVTGRAPAVERQSDEGLWVEGAGNRYDRTFSRSELVRARCGSLPTGASAAAIEREVDAAISGPAVVKVGDRYSTVKGVDEMDRWRERVATAAEGAHATLLAYDVGGRLDGRDALSAMAMANEVGMGRAVGVAPGRRAAASFEGMTGIETVGIRDAAGLAGTVRPYDLVVVAEAARLSADELGMVLDACADRDAQAVLFGTKSSMERSACLAEISTRIPEFRLQAGLELAEEWRDSATGTRRFGETELVIGRSSAALRSQAVDLACEDAAAGRPAWIVAPDLCAVRALKDELHARPAGPDHAPPPKVVNTGELAARLLAAELTPDGLPPSLTVIGGASMLPASVRSRGATVRRHLVVCMDAPRWNEFSLGRGAEAVGANYLSETLGAPKPTHLGRERWRAAASTLEMHRSKWGIEADTSAFGAARARDPASVSDELVVRRQVAQVRVKSVEISHEVGRGLDRGIGR